MDQILTYIKDKLHLEPLGKLGCRHHASGFRGNVLTRTVIPIHLNKMPVPKKRSNLIYTTLINLIW